jgi:microcystin-dependent protein
MSQFGQPPLAAFLPLRAGQNLSDLPDKPAALANLGTLSTSDIMMNSVPIGTIIPFWGNTAPVGYLPCNGQTVNSGTFPDLVTFLGGGSSQTLPDLRGEFLRGWDNGRGVDIGRAIKTAQADDLKAHTHTANGNVSSIGFLAAGPGRDFAQGSVTTSSTGGVETRPRNIAVLYCMKAYGALVDTSTANIGNVLTELSQCTKLTQFGSSLASPGYQRLPSGLIIQWGNFNSTTSSATTTYPIAFPNAILSKTVSVMDKTSGSSLLQLYLVASLNNSTTIGALMPGYDSGAWSAQWIAIGY